MNKIFAYEYNGKNGIVGNSHFVIIVAASDKETAKTYVKNQIGFESDPVQLTSASYPTIWTSDGEEEATIQAKILYNGSCHY